MSLNYVWGRAQRTLQWGIQMQIGSQLSIIFFIRTWWTNFFSIRLQAAGRRAVGGKSNNLWSWEQSGWNRKFSIDFAFCVDAQNDICSRCCRCHKTSKMQCLHHLILIPWGAEFTVFRKHVLPIFPPTTREQAVQPNKGKAPGGRYRVDLTFCFFTYRVKQIVDYNCSVLAVHSACFRRRTVEVLFVRSLIVLYLQFFFYGDCGGWQRPASFGIASTRNALQLIRCLRILITANVDWITEKTSSDETRRRNDSTRNKFMLNWLA